MTWVKGLPPAETDLDGALQLRPEFSEAFVDFHLSVLRSLDPIVVELCRLRIAQLMGSRFDLAIRFEPAIQAGLDEQKIAQLQAWPTSAAFSDQERACLMFAEKFVLDSASVTDADAEAVVEHLGTEGLALFAMALGRIDAMQRLCGALHLGAPQRAPASLNGFVLAGAGTQRTP